MQGLFLGVVLLLLGTAVSVGSETKSKRDQLGADWERLGCELFREH